MRRKAWICCLCLAASACGSSGEGSPEGATGGGPEDDASILGSSPALYTEQGISAFMSPEDTGYTLDEGGLRISGILSGTDYFEFDRGSFTRIDVQAFVAGVMQREANALVGLTLDNAGDGYSTLRGNGYFIGAYIEHAQTYTLAITGAQGSEQAYTLELKGRQ